MTKEPVNFDQLSAGQTVILKITGIMPLRNRTLNFSGTRILFMFYQIINIITVTMFLSYNIRMSLNHTYNLNSFCNLMATISIGLRYLIMSWKRADLIKLMKSCKKLWANLSTREFGIVVKVHRKAELYRKVILINCFGIVTSFLITSQVLKLLPGHNDENHKTLPFEFYVDVQTEPAYSLVLLFQAFLVYNECIIATVVDSTGPFLIMMACGYIRCIAERLLSVSYSDVDEYSIENVDEKRQTNMKIVVSSIKFHQKVICFCNDIHNLLKPHQLVTLIINLYLMSLMLIKVLETNNDMLNYLLLLSLTTIQMFISNYCSECLLSESQDVGEAAYFATSGCGLKAKKMLLLVMLRAQDPIQLTAGGYINLSIETFGKIIKNAFSFFTLARNFNL